LQDEARSDRDAGSAEGTTRGEPGRDAASPPRDAAMTLRRAGAEDVPRVRALTRAAYAHWILVIGTEPRPMTADHEAAVREHRVDLLEGDGAPADPPLGLIETRAEADHLLIVNVAVAPTLQGRGIGRGLVAHAEELARAAGLDEVRLYTNARFARNLRLYARLGYEPYREEAVPRVGIAIHMRKRLR